MAMSTNQGEWGPWADSSRKPSNSDDKSGPPYGVSEAAKELNKLCKIIEA